MSYNKSHTPVESNVKGRSMSVSHGSAGRGFATRNPFDALEAVSETRGGSSSGSPPSSGGSASQTSRGKGRIPSSQGSMSSPLSSPMASGNGNAYPPTTPHRQGLNGSSPLTPQGLPMGRNRNMAIQSTPSRESYGRSAFTSKPPVIPNGPAPTSLVGIPEVQAVQEFAFRAGQAEYYVCSERTPPSPFAKEYDELWLEFYVLGKTCDPQLAPTGSVPSSTSTFKNFPWVVLINPYTQSLQKPGGTVDAQWVRKVCGLALGCMAALVTTVCKRGFEWERTVCDVPGPIKQAIMHFPDLKASYEALQKDAKEALAGGLPAGYV